MSTTTGTSAHAERVLIDQDFCNRDEFTYGEMASSWEAQWIWHPNLSGTEPAVLLFRRVFDAPAKVQASGNCQSTVSPRSECLSESGTIDMTIHVSADQRFELFLDGELIGRGPERGDTFNWFYHSYRLHLEPGRHTLVARAWWIGTMAPFAQTSVRGGFILQADGEFRQVISTGVSDWDVCQVHAYSFAAPEILWGSNACMTVDGSKLVGDYRVGCGAKWVLASASAQDAGPVVLGRSDQHRCLVPATLHEMISEPITPCSVRYAQVLPPNCDPSLLPLCDDCSAELVSAWSHLMQTNTPVRIESHSYIRVLLDLQDYYCAYPSISVAGGKGSRIQILWSESLFDDPHTHSKGNRDSIDGKYLFGEGDCFLPDGRQLTFDILWWRAGRYVEIRIETADEPLSIESIDFTETRYPLENGSQFAASDSALESLIPIAYRTLQMCAHETYMDCPYYEQLMYVGDTRLEALVTYVTSLDDRLPRKALHMFNESRLPIGFTQSRYPCYRTQVIPPFSLWWVCMAHDYLMWRDDLKFVRSLLPGIRSVLAAFEAYLNKDTLLAGLPYWNFVDWVPGWFAGVPKDAGKGVSGIVNLQYILALQAAAEIESIVGDLERSRRYLAMADVVAEAVRLHFWDEGRAVFADDLDHTSYSEHMQCLAIISKTATKGQQDGLERILTAPNDLDKTTIYFSHYLFECLRMLGRVDHLIDKLGFWTQLSANGFKTLPERPEPARSDCHAWGAHPVYHLLTSVLGIRPDAAGFKCVGISPMVGNLDRVSGSMPHPQGLISAEFETSSGSLRGVVHLPGTVSGKLVWRTTTLELRPGNQMIEIP